MAEWRFIIYDHCIDQVIESQYSNPTHYTLVEFEIRAVTVERFQIKVQKASFIYIISEVALLLQPFPMLGYT